MEGKLFVRAYYERKADEPGKDGEVITFKASTAGVKRDGLLIDQVGWLLENYRKNPVVLWAHDYFGRNLPIGKTMRVEVEGDTLMADIQFDQADEFARAVERKYRTGYLNAVSVGWSVEEFKPSKGGEAPKVTKAELLDISAVPVPGDPDALMEREYRALRELFDRRSGDGVSGGRGAIPPHTTDKAEEGAEWDGAAEVAKADGKAQLRRMHAWVNEEGDAEAKQSYKLPHHMAESGQVVWRGVAAAMARLLQAGTQIPDADREGVYRHLARHYQQFDKEAPEFRSLEEVGALGEEEWRGMFLEGEIPDGKRVGAVLNNRNRGDLEEAVSLINGVLERAKKEADGDQEENPTTKDTKDTKEPKDGRETEAERQAKALEALRKISNQINQLGGM